MELKFEIGILGYWDIGILGYWEREFGRFFESFSKTTDFSVFTEKIILILYHVPGNPVLSVLPF